MAGAPVTSGSGSSSGSLSQGQGFILSMLASLFFMWGFLSVLQDILVPHLRAIFDLNYFQSMLVQFFWFGAYFVMSMPMAFLLQRIGYQKSLVTGLVMMAAGALLLVVAGRIANFEAHLLALFILASGVALLQVAANPYVAVIGPDSSAPARLNLVQAMNSTGSALAPLFGAWLILGRTTAGTAEAGAALTGAEKLADARSVELPYIGIAIVLIILALVFSRLKLPDLGAGARRVAKEERKKLSLWKHRNLVWGVPAIFMYLICEIGIGALFINLITSPHITGMTRAEAGGMPLFSLWFAMAIGRFAGAWLLTRFAAEKLLAGCALGGFLLLIFVSIASGPIVMYMLILVGLCHSIMFPTIFTLAIRGLGPLTEEGSGLLIMAIAGGALATLQGRLADMYGLQISFLYPAICELFVLWYALWGSKVTNPEPAEKLENA
jgi:FHS family L-fucose permease-like MFS transporter